MSKMAIPGSFLVIMVCIIHMQESCLLRKLREDFIWVAEEKNCQDSCHLHYS